MVDHWESVASFCGVRSQARLNKGVPELIDGYHRWKAHETAGEENVSVTVTTTKSDAEFLLLAIERNAKHGQQLTGDEKKAMAVKLYLAGENHARAKQCLAISERTYRNYVAAAAAEHEEETKRQVLEMHLACKTQREIADALGEPQQTVADKIAEFTESGKLADSGIFRNYEQDDSETSGRRIYTIWNFPKATNTTKHFGNIPPEIVDNLMYLYTKPLDVVFDPFGGGGSLVSYTHGSPGPFGID